MNLTFISNTTILTKYYENILHLVINNFQNYSK